LEVKDMIRVPNNDNWQTINTLVSWEFVPILEVITHEQ